MGLFKKIKKAVKKVAKKSTAAVMTGGVSLVSKKVEKAVSPVTNALLPTSASQIARVGLAVATKNPTYLIPNQKPVGGSPMAAFNVGGFLGSVGQILGGVQGANAGVIRAVGAVSTIAGASLAKPSAMTPARPSATPAMALKPAMSAAGAVVKAGAVVGRGFFAKYPNLATVIQKYRNAGMTQVTRARLHGLLKRFGPELLISGGILTAAAVSELMVAGPGYRRMNPTNIYALRRSIRRLESFHKICRQVDVLGGRGRSRKKCKTGSGGSTFVRQG